ncbi:MAG: hypothetical protein M3011_05235 [Actinomycetota bacterium]|nr:hypothetical protein [Actinomycetota bacterium]
MTIELDATAIEDVIHAALDEMPHADVAAIQALSVTDAARVEGPAAVTDVMEGGSAAPAAYTGTPAQGPFSGTPAQGPFSGAVTSDADQVADQGSEGPAQPRRAGYRGGVKPTGFLARDANRSPADRSVDDAPVLVALASRR